MRSILVRFGRTAWAAVRMNVYLSILYGIGKSVHWQGAMWHQGRRHAAQQCIWCRAPRKHALMCQNWARTGTMLKASGRFGSSSGTFRLWKRVAMNVVNHAWWWNIMYTLVALLASCTEKSAIRQLCCTEGLIMKSINAYLIVFTNI